MSVADQRKVFDLEIDAWCYGLSKYPGEVYPELVHAVIREMNVIFLQAIRYEILIDLIELAERIAKSSKYLVPEKELVFSLLAQLPSPKTLKTEGELYTLANVLDRVEQVYSGAVSRFEKRWAKEFETPTS